MLATAIAVFVMMFLHVATVICILIMIFPVWQVGGLRLLDKCVERVHFILRSPPPPPPQTQPYKAHVNQLKAHNISLLFIQTIHTCAYMCTCIEMYVYMYKQLCKPIHVFL